jgi:DinB family protein
VNAVTYAKTALESDLGLLGACAGGMDDAQYNWKPSGTANSAAKSHVHALTSIDFFINGNVRGVDLLWAAFAPKHNLPANPMGIWTYDGAIPVAAMQEYAAELKTAVLDYIGTLKDDDLDREIETQFFGKKPVSFLIQLSGMHAVGHGGDIAAVKGFQGLKGLPF